jgi:hypothetical protein
MNLTTTPPDPLCGTKMVMLLIDLGFLAYWLLIAGSVLPAAIMFPEYDDARVQAWNWSFLPLDLAASGTGLLSLALLRRRPATGLLLMTVSLTLTFCAGLMAIGYWTLRAQFDLSWWAPNLLLMIFPVAGVLRLTATDHRHAHPDQFRGDRPVPDVSS